MEANDDRSEEVLSSDQCHYDTIDSKGRENRDETTQIRNSSLTNIFQITDTTRR